MSKVKKIHQVFAVLSEHAPKDFASPGRLLLAASSLVDLFEEAANDDSFEEPPEEPAYGLRGADIAMLEHPWQLVCDEQCVFEELDLVDERLHSAYQQAKYLMEYEA